MHPHGNEKDLRPWGQLFYVEMCPPSNPNQEQDLPPTFNSPKSTCFNCTKLNGTTFQIVEDDKWSEIPFIYAKVYESVIVLIDTGCGGAARDPNASLTSLRTFLETFPVDENDGKPLNAGGKKGYLVVCSHCHFDHIGMRFRAQAYAALPLLLTLTARRYS